MKSTTHHIGKLEIIRREPSSRNGNPRWLVRVDGWTCYTAPDSMLGYKIRNFENKTVAAHIGTYYGRATLLDCKIAESAQ